MEVITLFAPFLVYLVLILVTGLVGNSIVFIVYYRMFKPSAVRTFILVMSLCDLLINVLSLPMQVVIRVLSDQDLGPLCPVFGTVHGFLLSYSAVILVAVALSRYLSICWPTRRFPIISNTMTTLIIGGAIAGILSSSNALMSGQQTVHYQDLNVTGISCFVKDEFVDSVSFKVFNGIGQSCFFIGLLIMAVSYGLIAWHLWQHRKLKLLWGKVGNGLQPSVTGVKLSSADESAKDRCSHHETSDFGLSTESTDESVAQGGNLKEIKSLEVEGESSEWVISNTELADKRNCNSAETCFSIPTVQTSDNICDGDEVSSTQECRHQAQPKFVATTGKQTSRKIPQGSQCVTRRATLMMFVLTVVYFVNFLPYIVMLAIYGSKEITEAGFWGINMYHIARKSYYINSAINPLVYGLCSAIFRRHCRHLIFRCKSSD